MKIKKLIAAAVAVVITTGSIGTAAFIGFKKGENTLYSNAEYSNAEYNENLAKVQNLQFKINEMWRLGLNSSLNEDIKNAIQKVNSEFNSEKLTAALELSDEDFEVVADEYLLSLQLEIDFDNYIDNREMYEKEKASAVNIGEILTCARIDEYLNKLNIETAAKQVAAATAQNVNVGTPHVNVSGTDIAVPKAKDVLPENPGEAVKRETGAISNSAMRIEVD